MVATDLACAALRESRTILTSYSNLSDYDREKDLKPVQAALATGPA